MPLLNAKSVTVNRYAQTITNYVKGESLESSFEIKASIQAISGAALQNLPDGFRRLGGNKYKVYANTPLRTGDDSELPDRIVYDGRVLHVHSGDNNSQGLLSHYRYFCFEPA